MKLIFKHSPVCVVSLAGKREVDKVLERYKEDFEFELIDVISDKDRSREVSELFDVKHESPQIIVLDGENKVLWDASHFEIKADKIMNILSENKKK